MPAARRFGVPGMALAALLLVPSSARAQELEPRAYSPSPTGTSFVVAALTRSAGGVFTDPSVPLIDVEAQVEVLSLGGGHSFALLGKPALLLGLAPVAWAQASGAIGEERRETSRRGLADPRVKLSMILAGSRPMSPADFARAPRRAIVGVSVTAVAPLGQYDAVRLINLGSNRWSFKPEAGVSLPRGRWTVEAFAGVWFFTDNKTYFPGRAHREQEPVVAVQTHVSYTIGRRAWVAVNGTWYGGGQVIVDGQDVASPYKNTRLGATLALPIGTRQSFKIAYSAGAATRIGADFRTLTGAWQLVIF